MNKARFDTPIAMIFFNRPEQFARVFEEVKRIRPSKLFLIQDGPRENNLKDYENIQKCREIVNIDWECEVKMDFSECNLGCGKRIFSGLSKCFEDVDRLIILEDDCIPSQSFFPFCHELLEKYKDDARVGFISGMNHLNRFDAANDDYFFSEVGSIAGWATWKRVWKDVKFNLGDLVNDGNAMRLLSNYENRTPYRTKFYPIAKAKYKQMECGEKLSSWSTQFGINQVLNSQLIIVPKVNLMTNIGLTAESANSVSNIRFIPRGMRPLYRLKLFELEFPLKHPRYVINDVEYCKAVGKIMAPNGFASYSRKIESVFLRIIGGDFKSLKKGITRRILKLFR